MSDLEKQFSELESFGDLLEACAANSGVRKQYLSYIDWALHEEGIRSATLREGREEGIELGIEKGREEGIEKRNITIVLDMLAEGYSVEAIEKISKVPREKIEEIMRNEVRV